MVKEGADEQQEGFPERFADSGSGGRDGTGGGGAGRTGIFAGARLHEREARAVGGEEGVHVPKVTVAGGKVTILTPHPMTPPHFIVKHTLLTPEGKIIGEKTFTAAGADWVAVTGWFICNIISTTWGTLICVESFSDGAKTVINGRTLKIIPTFLAA